MSEEQQRDEVLRALLPPLKIGNRATIRAPQAIDPALLSHLNSTNNYGRLCREVHRRWLHREGESGTIINRSNAKEVEWVFLETNSNDRLWVAECWLVPEGA